MILELYDKLNNKRMEIAPAESSNHTKAIQSDNILSLSFVSYDCIALEVTDYIDFCNERFWVIARYVPKQKSTVEWEYSVQLYGIESLIKQFLVLKTVNGADDAEFSYTASAYDHVALIVNCINAGMGTTDWKVGEVVESEYLDIDYAGTYCDAGLKIISDRCKVEYWIDGTTINVSRCEHGENINLGYDNGLTNIYSDTASNVKFFTRLFPIGSSRNIVYDDYGSSRLQLPNGVKYVDKDVTKFGVVHHYEKDAFSHIYPRRIGTISSVRTNDVTGEDGNSYTIYYFKDSNLDFNPNDYEIAGLVKNISMQNGDLMGRDFEVNYNAVTNEFEVITIWPYENDVQLPNEQLTLEVGNEYILWNITMPIEYYPPAEQEYADAVSEYLENSRLDVSIYIAHTDYIDIAQRDLNLTVGQRVRLIHNKYFNEGYRDSRITKITRKVLRPTEMDLEISDVLSKGALETVNESIADVSHSVKVTTGGFPDIIKSTDNTSPSDTTIYSSRAVDSQYLSRRRDERTPNKIASDKGFEVGQYMPGNSGTGGRMGVDKNGNSYLEVHYLYARIKAYFDTLEINRVQANIGNRIMSPAGIKCSSVEELDDRWRCYFVAQDEEVVVKNTFVVGDLAYALSFDTKSIGTTNFTNHYYWRAVVGIGDNYIEISKSDKSNDTVDSPKAGDNIVQRGNKTDPTRQNFIEERSFGINAPSYIVYQGVNDYTIVDKEVVSYYFDTTIGQMQVKIIGNAQIGTRDGKGINITNNNVTLRGVEFTVDGGNQSIEDIALAAKDDLARTLGYSDGYAALLDEYSAGKTIIKGGIINTSLLDVNSIIADIIATNNLFVRRLQTNDDPDRPKIIIDDQTNSIQSITSDGRVAFMLTGDEITGLDDIIGNYPDADYPIDDLIMTTVINHNNNISNTATTQTTFEIASPKAGVMTIPSSTLTISISSVPTDGITASFSLVLQKQNDNNWLNYKDIYTNILAISSTEDLSMYIPAISLASSIGDWRIYAKVVYDGAVNDTGASIVAQAQIEWSDEVKLQVSNELVAIGRNAFIYAVNNHKYVMLIEHPDEPFIQVKGCGQWVSPDGTKGIEITDDGVAISGYSGGITINPTWDSVTGKPSWVASSSKPDYEWEEIDDKPTSFNPANHASSAMTYGVGNGTYYGHLKLTDTPSTQSSSSGTAATPALVGSAIEDIEIGGVNLFANSSETDKPFSIPSYNYISINPNGVNYVTLAEYGLKVGDTFTASAILTQNQDGVAVDTRLTVAFSTGSEVIRYGYGAYASFGGISKVTDTIPVGTVSMWIFASSYTGGTIGNIRMHKLERGNKATAWSPSLADTKTVGSWTIEESTSGQLLFKKSGVTVARLDSTYGIISEKDVQINLD